MLVSKKITKKLAIFGYLLYIWIYGYMGNYDYSTENHVSSHASMRL